ncbi:hypothetical protein ASG17_07745 [Brevundimonas sp. Leaf363]|uniref:hypothetical protein n=1 Tax=Brevundimonas sp. Leaf363 TaxID=1736353 RepID=UPI0006FE4DB4|nr:hypothetical protein [Brevundimonas sp. Leaf363]KQS55935.1 hypothetical protein ASG17_07745 [Brevundimonas sp. Leaf363]
MSLHQPQARPQASGVPAQLAADLSHFDAAMDRDFPRHQPATYADLVGKESGLAQTLMRRAATRFGQFESVMLDHWRFRRASRQPVEAMPKLALRHLNAVLDDYDALAPIMAELRARRDAAVAPIAKAA